MPLDLTFAPVRKLVYSLIAFQLLAYSCQLKENKFSDKPSYTIPKPSYLSKSDSIKWNEKISHFFDSTLLKHKGFFNGSILIAKGGNILYESYVGYSNFEKKEDTLTENTPIHIASASKTFTAMAILQLIEKDKLKLTDTITKFFPTLPYPGVTIKMLLSHRSGIPNYVHFLDQSGWDQSKYIENKDVLDILINQHPPASYPPDSHFEYSNTNYLLLALVIEKITGMDYPNYMQQYVFNPLGMKNSFVYTTADSARATKSYSERGISWGRDYMDHTYGDKNIYSTPRDLLNWDRVLYTNQFLSKAMLELAYSPSSFEKKSFHNYGLGWRLLMLPNGKKIIYHFGRWHGNNAAFARIPDQDATIIILGNRFSLYIYNVAHACYNLFETASSNSEKEED